LRQDALFCDVGAEVEKREAHWPSSMIEYKHGTPKFKAGRTHTDRIGVGAGADIGGTGISCHFLARQDTGPTRQSYRDDHRHVGAMPATPSINRSAFSVSVESYEIRAG
jgi:hypothetical protein